MAKLAGREVHIMPITLRNEGKAREWHKRITEYSNKVNASVFIDTLQNVFRLYPDTMDFINEIGGLNTETIKRRGDAMIAAQRAVWENEKAEAEKEGKEYTKEYQPMSEDVAYKLAAEELSKSWQVFLRDNQEVGKLLYFNLQGFPVTLDALKLGIECIKDTVDRSRTSGDVLAEIDSDVSGDFWQDVTAAEVAAYVDTFRSLIQ